MVTYATKFELFFLLQYIPVLIIIIHTCVLVCCSDVLHTARAHQLVRGVSN